MDAGCLAVGCWLDVSVAQVKLPLFALLDTRPLMLDAGVADDDDLDVTATAPEEAAGTAQKR